MAVAVLTEVEGAGLDTYEAVNEKIRLAENPPDGLLVHTAAARDGGYFIYNVWDSASAWEAFRDGRRSDALREAAPAGIAPPKITVWELHAFTTFASS
ncbi:MAG: hypothetical protein ABSG64_04060 [Solirubrobacteraceae bacterium]|jgi:hypothetical protein